jgi:NADPH:quinone reductase-like Zn-dependent oxidoreductase
VDRTPVIPSHEVSGVVAGLGDGVSDFSLDDEVYGLIPFDRDGAAAEYVAVPAADLAARPASVSHVVTAALPLAGLTAWQALVDHAKVQRGQKVLVLGGAGGVGAFAVQLAHMLGAGVTATIRSDAAELVRGFGADHVIDTRFEAFDRSGPIYHVVIDTVGGETLDRAFTVLRHDGRLVTLSAPPPAGKADEYGVSAIFFIVVSDRDQLTELAELADTSGLQVAIADTFPLDRGREAFESGRAANRRAGKTVLVVRN